MKTLLTAALLCACVAASGQAPPQGFVILKSTRVLDLSGNPADGQVCAQIKARGAALGAGAYSVNPAGGGITTKPAVCTNIAGGAFSLFVPDTSLSGPQWACIALNAVDNVSGASLLDSGLDCLQTTSAAGSAWCSASAGVTTCNLDNYPSNLSALPPVNLGPAGRTGDKGDKGDKGDPGNVAADRMTIYGAGQECMNSGDSITGGHNASPANGTGNVYSLNGYATLLDNYMGWTCVNQGISGSEAMDAAQADMILNSTVTQGSITTLLPGANDMRNSACQDCVTGMSTPYAQEQYASQVRANAVWRAIPDTAQKIKAQSCSSSTWPQCIFSGTWTTASAAATMLTTQVGASVTINFSGTTHYFTTILQKANSSTYTLTVDNNPISQAGSNTLSSSGAILHTFNDINRNYSYNAIRVAGLSAGMHQAKFTCTAVPDSSSACYFSWTASNEGAASRLGPNVYIGTTLRALPAGYSSFGGSDTIVGQFVAQDKEIAAELASDQLHVQTVDTWSVMNPMDSTLWDADGFHPNTKAHARLAAAFENAITGVSLPNDRGSAQILQNVSICTKGGMLIVGRGCPSSPYPGTLPVAGAIGSNTGLSTGQVNLGGDLYGGLFRDGLNTMTLLGSTAGLNRLNIGGRGAGFPGFNFGYASVVLTDAAGTDNILFGAHQINSTTGYQFNGITGFTGTIPAGSCAVVKGGLTTGYGSC